MGRSKQTGRRVAGRVDGKVSEGLEAKRRWTPEDRRSAVEAYEKSGLTQREFARQWGVSPFTLSVWLRKSRTEGPRGLERLADGPPKRRGKAPLPAALKAAIVEAKRRFPDFGLKKLKAWLWRFGGLKVSRTSVRRVVDAAGLERAPAPRKRRRAAPPRRFERSRPGELWQSDITYLHVPWSRRPLYLVAWMDDFSRYVVGWGLYTHQRATIVIETFLEACSRCPKPTEALTDQGRQYYAWRGKSEFTKVLDKEGVKHVVARAQHPETVGKVERLWATIKQELWDRVHPKDIEEARERIRLFIAHHNFHRPHQSLDGHVPADRYFGVQSEVRAAVEATVAKNALRLALGEAPRKPVFLVGQIDGQSVSLHGESGRIVVQTPDGEVKEIATKDLGVPGGPAPKGAVPGAEAAPPVPQAPEGSEPEGEGGPASAGVPAPDEGPPPTQGAEALPTSERGGEA
jgi:transposase InsO family protein